jgi:hypothetical protein
VHEGGALDEDLREDSEAGAHLEHDVLRAQVGEAGGHRDDVLVGEKVLAELASPAKRQADQSSPKASSAFASIWRPRSEDSSPRVSARALSVWTTLAGSFRFPRTGCGAR